jgi:hypothetical protein
MLPSCKPSSATFSFIAAGLVYQTSSLGHFAFELGKPGNSPEGSGFDIAIVRDGFIVELYTVLTDHAP